MSPEEKQHLALKAISIRSVVLSHSSDHKIAHDALVSAMPSSRRKS